MHRRRSIEHSLDGPGSGAVGVLMRRPESGPLPHPPDEDAPKLATSTCTPTMLLLVSASHCTLCVARLLTLHVTTFPPLTDMQTWFNINNVYIGLGNVCGAWFTAPAHAVC